MNEADREELDCLLRALCAGQESVSLFHRQGPKAEKNFYIAVDNRDRGKRAIVAFVERLSQRGSP